MRIKGFDWNRWNIEHIDRHSVTPQEVEEACYNQPISRKTKNGLYIVYGQTDAGRYLFIVVRYNPQGIVYVITARIMTKKEQIYYHKRR
ncbi:MAG: BrnT family toxin [Candidatus Omnitrophica bacterium]|nr:BrnT family toxin [Candidatus Omnitrophota bacterium]MBU1367010.1 BrnT family toxin [Candidatus Omnitrophota bacterium]MBU1524305.1 BrnT family toxin [Candidatus Omnitrophota bacterium]MBU1809729.1 BrnT family toxin [Candidatus Omnitrophota bacterium]MBU2436635.1 BrnT family toxin [Candidatus Omnitrophota bacterium]